MAVSQVSEKDVDDLLKISDLEAVGTASWKCSSNKSWYRAEVEVQSGKVSVNLKIVITVNMYEPTIYSFALIYNNAFRIRGLDINGSHSNKHTNSEKWIATTHKHKWTNECRDRFAYTPNDITAEDIGGRLEQFCGECNIQYGATLNELPPIQGTFFDEV